MADFFGDAGPNAIDGLPEGDFIDGAGGDDILNGLGGDDLLDGGDGDDFLDGGAGDDVLNGGGGNDDLFGDGFGDSVAISGDDMLNGDDGDDFLSVAAGIDVVDGGAGFDTVSYRDFFAPTGLLFTPTTGEWNVFDGPVIGRVRNVESIIGTFGDDDFEIADDFQSNGDRFINIRGGAGDDDIQVLAMGDPQVSVRADYRDAQAGVVVRLDSGAVSAQPNDLANIGVDTFVGVIEQVRGSQFGDQLIGTDRSGFESFRPESGNDFVDGRGGTSDRIDYRNTPIGVTVDLEAGLTTEDGFGFFDVLVDIEDVRGSAFGDMIMGDDGANFFQPRAGDDVIDGRGGFDSVSYQFETNAGIQATLGAMSSITGNGSVGTDQLVSIEYIRGTNGIDTFTAQADFDGTFGRFNVFEGLAGDDLVNGNGVTRIEYDRGATSRIFADLAAGFVIGDASVGQDSVSGIFEVQGTAFDDIMFGSDGAGLHPDVGFESFRGLAGNDLIDGRSGMDRANYQFAPNGVDVNLLLGVALDDGFGDSDTLFNIEAVKGTDHADILTGDDGDNDFEPLLGPDMVDGGEGVDTLNYDDLTDSVVIDLLLERVIHADSTIATAVNFENATGGEAGDELIGTGGDNVLLGEDGDDRLVGLAGMDEIRGGFGADTIFGNSGDDLLLGEDGDDRINGGFGADDMRGGRGSDVYFVDNAGDMITEMANGGGDIETVFATATFTLPTAVDNLALIGGGDIDGNGNGNANLLVGNDAQNRLAGGGNNDTLDGAGGDDMLLGGNGDDVLIDRGGADTMDGGAGADVFVLTDEGGAGNVINGYTPGVDAIDLVDFGFADATAALAIFFQSGASTMFSPVTGVDYLFTGISASSFSAADLII